MQSKNGFRVVPLMDLLLKLRKNGLPTLKCHHCPFLS